jgi:hypothetical protein
MRIACRPGQGEGRVDYCVGLSKVMHGEKGEERFIYASLHFGTSFLNTYKYRTNWGVAVPQSN